MPWSKTKTIPSLAKRSEKVKEVFAKAANAALEAGKSEEDAVFAGLAAVKNYEKTLKKSLEDYKPKLPSHVLALTQTTLEKAAEVLPEECVDENKIKRISFNKQQQIEIVFEDGHVITSNPIDLREQVNQYVTVSFPKTFDYVRFDTDVDNPLHEEGLLFYDRNDHSLSYYNEDDSVTVNIGREQLARVYNNTGQALTNGSVVFITGSFQGTPTVELATAANVTSQSIIGIVTGHIHIDAYGYVCTAGLVRDLDLSSYPEGTVLYLSDSIPGGFTDTKPLQPSYVVEIGVVLDSEVSGKIYTRIDKKDWFPYVEIVNSIASYNLPLVDTVYIGGTVIRDDGFEYDPLTGELTILNNASYSISILINAIPSASNKNIYFYAEEYHNGVWVKGQYSGRTLRLPNQQETQVVVSADRYYSEGTKIRLHIWGDDTVSLITTNLPGVTPIGSVKTPAFRFMMAS